MSPTTEFFVSASSVVSPYFLAFLTFQSSISCRRHIRSSFFGNIAALTLQNDAYILFRLPCFSLDNWSQLQPTSIFFDRQKEMTAKLEADKAEKLIRELMNKPENKQCADCKARVRSRNESRKRHSFSNTVFSTSFFFEGNCQCKFDLSQ
jgi:hypothetical protein